MIESAMRRVKLKNIVSWIVLAYFAFFIVPPVSSFASYQAEPVSPEAGYRLVQTQRAPVLLFDIVLWQQLKKTKHTNEFLVSFTDNVQGESLIETGRLPAGVDIKPECFLFLTSIRNIQYYRQSRSSTIRFSRSGISPPTHSS